jgi:hypothetical protein
VAGCIWHRKRLLRLWHCTAEPQNNQQAGCKQLVQELFAWLECVLTSNMMHVLFCFKQAATQHPACTKLGMFLQLPDTAGFGISILCS